MSIFYADNAPPFTGTFNPLKVDAVKKWLTHYGNYLILEAISQAPQSADEKRRALKELTVCERKMAYWARQPHFEDAEARRGAQALKAQWR